MPEPTQEQIKEFWEWCGFAYDEKDRGSTWVGGKWKYGTGYSWTELPPIDLNTLFRWATPKVIPLLKGSDHEFFGWKRLLDNWLPYLVLGEDPALALFWVLWQVKEGEEE